MNTVKLVWITPNGEEHIVYAARVSNPKSQEAGAGSDRLIAYLKKHHHWSPFEMASACIEINTTRDIARQILRHRSFSFQEFSQRYADVSVLPKPEIREARLQDLKNRQSSIESDDDTLKRAWKVTQEKIWKDALDAYVGALNSGVAKEVARALLPEGLTPSRLYMAGTIRSWIHYCDLRSGEDTQKEHRLIARSISDLLSKEMPNIFKETVV